MEQEKQKLEIESGDFITPKKAITISTISLVIWFVTGLSYKLLTVLHISIPYTTYALFVSLILSILFSIYIVKTLVGKTDLGMKIILGVLNTILIYTSANGAQATYSYLSPREKPDKPSTHQSASLIPFLDARPWIPDKFLQSENEALTNKNAALISENESLAKQNNFLLTRIDLLKDSTRHTKDWTHNEILLLNDSVALLLHNFRVCQQKNEELTVQVNQLLIQLKKTKTQALQDSVANLERVNEACVKNNNRLSGDLKTLQERIKQFNSRQKKWNQTVSGRNRSKPGNISYLPQEQAAVVKRQVNAIMKDSTYYDFLFLK